MAEHLKKLFNAVTASGRSSVFLSGQFRSAIVFITPTGTVDCTVDLEFKDADGNFRKVDQRVLTTTDIVRIELVRMYGDLYANVSTYASGSITVEAIAQ